MQATSEIYEQFFPNYCKWDLVFATVEIEGFTNNPLCYVLATWAMSAFHMWRSFKKFNLNGRTFWEFSRFFENFTGKYNVFQSCSPAPSPSSRPCSTLILSPGSATWIWTGVRPFIPQCMDNLPEATHPNRNESSSSTSHQLPSAPQLGVESHASFLRLCCKAERLVLCNHSCRVLTSAVAS